ncbi:phage tail protein [Citrobacter sp. Cf118]|uniref:phage tail protein n=1 Tax=Citrobacter sp. Cf118 TaxID=2985069 RepID=UPI002577AC60|nr:phage tail protein [Citrobacter sp. Cf118]MDM3162718.1 phage tail protein [Citrobacter sp. Cf118]
MATKYLALLTNIGAAKLAKATALGTKVEITQLAVGDGNGVLPTPNPAQTALVHELRRAPLNMLTVEPANASQIIAEQVIPEDVGGWWIREIGLFDKDGDMVAIANCAETYKPQLQEGSGRVQVIRVILIVSSTEAVTLKIDPAVVLATRQYVDNKIIEVKSYADELMRTHEQSRNHPDATTSAKGFTQLNSSVTDDRETQSATPKAVKIAMDNANARLAKDRNLADLPNPALARQNLQLGDSSTKNTGTTANTVASGDDARITGAMQKSQNGADIPDVAKFLQNLGLGDGTGRLIAVYRIEASRKIGLPPGTKFVVADLIGAGGGGGSNSTTVQPGYASAAQGGNSGSRVVAKFNGYEGQEIDVTIGAGGTGGVATPATGADGATGGSTIVGTGIAATGGRGGIRGAAFNVLPTSGPTASPNADNTISNGVELIAQHTGHGGSSGFLFSDKNALGGKGADSEFGTGGVAIAISAGINASGGNNARGNGAGGSGAVSIYGTGSTGVSMPGGTGANGLAILWVYG